jgi:hypothetical protein
MYKKTEKMVAEYFRPNRWIDLVVGEEYDVIGFQDDRDVDGRFYYRLSDGNLYWDRYFTVTYMVPVYEDVEPSFCACCGRNFIV